MTAARRRRRTGSVALVVFVLLGVAMSACSSETNGSTIASVPDATVVDGTFTTEALDALVARATAALRATSSAAEVLSAEFTPCPGDDASAIEAWRLVRTTWDRAGVYHWGPAQDVNFVSAIDFWPTDTAAVSAAVDGESPMTSLEYDSLGAAARGLPALETLLFGPQPLTARGCSFGTLAAASIAATTSDMADQFESERDSLTGGDQAIVDALGMLADAVYEVCDLQLGMPSGNTVVGSAPDAALVRQGSGRMSADDVRTRIAEIHAAFDDAVQPIVAARYAGAQNPVTELFGQFDAAFASVGDIGAAIDDDPDALAQATTSCRSIRRAFSTNVSGLLGVTLVLPLGDGD